MRNSIFIGGAGIACILAGILLKDISKILSLILILIGIITCMAIFLSVCMKHADRCPKCGVILYRNIKVYREQRDGLIRCPKCSSLVRVAERKLK